MEVKNFRFKDKDGNVLYEFPITGVAPDITVSASVDNNVGTPSVTVTKSGENDAPTYQLDFKNLKGDTGPQGVQGIQGVQGPPVTLDASVSTTSHNGVENQAITNYVNTIFCNNMSDLINIMSYTKASPYVAPNDGYITVINSQTVKGYCVVQSASNNISGNVGMLAEGYFQLFIKKGMRLYPSLAKPPSDVLFYSLID